MDGSRRRIQLKKIASDACNAFLLGVCQSGNKRGNRADLRDRSEIHCGMEDASWSKLIAKVFERQERCSRLTCRIPVLSNTLREDAI